MLLEASRLARFHLTSIPFPCDSAGQFLWLVCFRFSHQPSVFKAEGFYRQQLKRLENRTQRDDSRLTMKSQLIAIVAAVLVVGCGESQQSAPAPESKPVAPVAEAAQPEPSTQKELHKKSCYNQLKQIDGGKEMWAVQERRADGDTPSDSQLGAYFKDGMPSCPGGGAYTIGAVANPATCSIHSKPARPAIQTRGKKPAVSRNIPVRRVKHSEADDALISAAVHRNIKARDNSIHDAAVKGNIETVKQHLAAGADLSAQRYGQTPLHYAAREGHKEIVKLLIAEGADVNVQSHLNETPLHQAAWHSHKEVIELLIASGANVNAKNNLGGTPLDEAILRNRIEITNLLRKHGGKTGEELKAEGK